MVTIAISAPATRGRQIAGGEEGREGDAGQVARVLGPRGDGGGQGGIAHPQTHVVVGAGQMGGQGRAPRAASDHGHVHGETAGGAPSRRSVPARMRLRFPRCFHTMSVAATAAAAV